MDLIQLALDCGAFKADIIRQDQIVLSSEFRSLCEMNSCGNYGRTYTCPPAVGSVGELMEQVRGYDRALLYQTVAELEDSFDVEGMIEGGKRHSEVCQNVRRALPSELGPVLHLAGGGCRLCERCAMQDKLPCRHPEAALPSLSAYGVDVCSTSRSSNMKYINGQNTVTYFGLVLFKEEA